ncbi:MAG: flagella basal body P-ring formation protein FlgA [Pseudomonadota bacterium]|nr:flagella basal body P-ring formation protein FlgA [Pseudomonadota bacterium]
MMLSLLLAAAVPATASHQDTPALDRAVAAFTGHGIGDDGGARTAIDPRLRLAQCPTVALSWRTDRHDAVVVACSGPNWRLFVPVIGTVAVVAGAAPAATRVAYAPPVKLEPVIKRGDPVTIEAGDAGFSISREGVAIGDAAPGERFMVRVDGTRTPVQAVAVGSGRATLPGWAD